MEFFFGAFTDDYSQRAATIAAERLRKRSAEEEEERKRRELMMQAAAGGAGRGARSRPASSAAKAAPRTMEQRFSGLSSGSQASVVKLASFGSGARIASMVDYLSREGDLQIEDETGRILVDQKDMRDLSQEWEVLCSNRQESQDIAKFRVQVELGPNDAAQQDLFNAVLSAGFSDRRLMYAVTDNGAGRYTVEGVMVLRSSEGERFRADHLVEDLVQKRFDASALAADVKAAFRFEGYGNGTNYGAYAVRELVERFGDRIYNQRGENVDSAEKAVKEVTREWRQDLHSRKSRDVMHLVISSKAGTDADAFRSAVREFLAVQFPGHRYAFALHDPENDPKDSEHGGKRPHVHAHAIITTKSLAGDRIVTTPEVFREWRSTMAEQARAQGIGMEMTDRRDIAAAPAYSRTQVRAASYQGRTAHVPTSQAAQARYTAKRQNHVTPARTQKSLAYMAQARQTWTVLAQAVGSNQGTIYSQAATIRLSTAIGQIGPTQSAAQTSAQIVSFPSGPSGGPESIGPKQSFPTSPERPELTVGDFQDRMKERATMSFDTRAEFMSYEKDVRADFEQLRNRIGQEGRALGDQYEKAITGLLDAQRERMEASEAMMRLEREQGTANEQTEFKAAAERFGVADTVQGFEIVKSLEHGRYYREQDGDNRKVHEQTIERASERLVELAERGNRFAQNVVGEDAELSARANEREIVQTVNTAERAELNEMQRGELVDRFGEDRVSKAEAAFRAYEVAIRQMEELKMPDEPLHQADGTYSYPASSDEEIDDKTRKVASAVEQAEQRREELIALAVNERNGAVAAMAGGDDELRELITERERERVSTVGTSDEREEGQRLMRTVEDRLESIRQAEDQGRDTSFSQLSYNVALREAANAAIEGNSYMQDLAKRTQELHLAIEQEHKAKQEQEREQERNSRQSQSAGQNTNQQRERQAGDSVRTDPASQQVRRTEELENQEQVSHNKRDRGQDMEA